MRFPSKLFGWVYRGGMWWQKPPQCMVPEYNRPNPLIDLNAAVALVPEDWCWKVFNDAPGDVFWAEVSIWDAVGGWRKVHEGPFDNPAAALCIALLKSKGE